ncbi:hypothetical protein D3C85_1328930 [compost metagenome]
MRDLDKGKRAVAEAAARSVLHGEVRAEACGLDVLALDLQAGEIMRAADAHQLQDLGLHVSLLLQFATYRGGPSERP